MTSSLERFFKKVLNDNKIFYRSNIIIDSKEWAQIKHLYNNRPNSDLFIASIDKKIETREKEKQLLLKNAKQNKNTLKRLNEQIRYLMNLKKSLKTKPFIFDNFINDLDDFSVVRYNLPNMDDFGKVIERFNKIIVKEYFFSKIQRSKRYEKEALISIFNIIEEMYEMNIPRLEIAFFIRKLKSLKSYWKIIS